MVSGLTAEQRTLFTVPASVDEADRLAAELGALASATGWQLSALLAARVQLRDRPGRPSGNVNLDYLSPAGYAALGLRGLRSPSTVRAHVRAWHAAIAKGIAKPVELGDTIELPTADFHDFYLPLSQADPDSSAPATGAEGRPSGTEPPRPCVCTFTCACGAEGETIQPPAPPTPRSAASRT